MGRGGKKKKKKDETVGGKLNRFTDTREICRNGKQASWKNVVERKINKMGKNEKEAKEGQKKVLTRILEAAENQTRQQTKISSSRDATTFL